MYDDVPEKVKKLPREQRIKWHRTRIQREEPAYKILEGVRSHLTDSQLKHALMAVKAKRGELERVLDLYENQEFKEVMHLLGNVLTNIRKLLCQRVSLQEQWFKRRYSPSSEIDLRRLKDEQVVLTQDGMQLEIRVISVCAMYNVDPAPFLKLEDLVMEKLNHV